MKTVYIVNLIFDINFRDADDGDCYAGEGGKLVAVFESKENAESLVSEWSSIFAAAGNENTVIPVQPNNRKLREKFGFDIHDLEQGNYNFRLTATEAEVIS